ncbi:hypothetical protein H4217_005078 [Coemansia sp. RSA 1939]|nr:hypothetical protein H4217_005078 [Coemansia sp. RSA 1939]KAJ2615571.1 hypothetical protein EV177_001502 [Coemansia sp. RSA 1804]KAJ2680490.1 hypothetical protein GGH99_005410 [Coemansia sp. RSA 1285]
MQIGGSFLRLLRFSLYWTAVVLVVIELIVDALSLSSINKWSNETGGLFDHGVFNELRGAAGYTMFVTLLTLLLMPAIVCGSGLAQRGITVAAILNRVVVELATVAVLMVLWFVSGVVMANYAGTGGCGGNGLCSRFKAATAFAWLLFFDLLAATAVLVLILLRTRSSGGDIRTTYAYDVGEPTATPAMVAGAPMHADQPYPPSVGGVESYYGNQPKVAMPAPN